MRQTMTVRPIKRICLISMTPLLAVIRGEYVPDAGAYMSNTKGGDHGDVKKTIAAVRAVALMSIGVLSGCSSDDAAPVEESALVAQAVPLAPGNSVAWAPGQDAVTILVGQFIDITIGDPLATTVSSSDPRTLKPFPGKQDEGKIFYPAAKGINPGAATLTVTLPDGSSYDTNITVTE